MRGVKVTRTPQQVTRSTQTDPGLSYAAHPGPGGSGGDGQSNPAVSIPVSIVAEAVTEMSALVEEHSRSAITAAVDAESSARRARRAAERALMEAELVAARATDGLPESNM